MVAVIKTYSIDNSELPVISEMQKILGREGKRRGLSGWIINQMKEYVKVHKSGNPIYPITKFFDPDFMAFPAFKENIQSTWIPYLQKSNDESIKEIVKQAYLISIYAKAYLSTDSSSRKTLNFGNLYTVEETGRMINSLDPKI